MKQLSALGARRHAFFRSPRRMRPLGGRLDESEMLGSTPYTYYGGEGPAMGVLPRPPSPPPNSFPPSSSLFLPCPASPQGLFIFLFFNFFFFSPRPPEQPHRSIPAHPTRTTAVRFAHRWASPRRRPCSHPCTHTRPRRHGHARCPPPPLPEHGGGAAAPLPQTKPQLRGFCAPFRPHLFQLPPGPRSIWKVTAAGLPPPTSLLPPAPCSPPISCIFKASPLSRGFPGNPCCPAVGF